jgi:hypothetical protein
MTVLQSIFSETYIFILKISVDPTRVAEFPLSDTAHHVVVILE